MAVGASISLLVVSVSSVEDGCCVALDGSLVDIGSACLREDCQYQGMALIPSSGGGVGVTCVVF